MTGIGTGMGKAFAAIAAAEWFLAGMDADMLFEVVLEFESLVAVGAFEFAQKRRFVVADHVALQAIDVGEALVADFATL